MAERVWTLNDIAPLGLAQEFEAVPAETGWTLNDIAPLGLTQTFAAPASEWTNSDWLLGLGMVQAAESGGSSPVALVDSAASTDVLGLQAQPAPADSGAGSDAIALVAGLPFVDSASGADGITALSAAVPCSDAGAGNDALGMVAATDLADSGAGSDALTINNGGSQPVDLADAAVGDDWLGVSVPALPSTAGGWRSPRRQSSPMFLPPMQLPPPVLPGIENTVSDDDAAGMDALAITVAALLQSIAQGSSNIEIDKQDKDLEMIALALAF